MGMPAAKRQRRDLNDSFEDELIIVQKNNGSNDSFDDDPMEPRPSILVGTNSRGAPPAASISTDLLGGNTSQHDIFSRQSGHASMDAPGAGSLHSNTSILTSGQKESGALLMMRKQKENLTRQLEDVRREKRSKEIVHQQEKKELERNYEQKLQILKSQKDQIHRELVSMSLRQENLLNMTVTGGDHDTTIATNKSFIPTKPVDRKKGKNQAIAWMTDYKTTIKNENMFKHPVNPNLDDTYLHFTTQQMDRSTFVPPVNVPRNHREERKPMLNKECQTVEDKGAQILKVCKRDLIIDGLLVTAAQMKEEDFNKFCLEDLCRDSNYKPLIRRKVSQQPGLSPQNV